MDIVEITKRCYEASKNKGFWDTERNQTEAFALILSELFEALEAHRNNRFANLSNFEFVSSENPNFIELFKLRIKDTVEDELADILIRLFDFCGGYNIDLDNLIKITPEDNNFSFLQLRRLNNFAEKILYITHLITDCYYKHPKTLACVTLYKVVLVLCQQHKINIEKHIELKLQYNATRGYKHHKEY